jgi:hypothetical protein
MWKWSHCTPFYTTPQPAQATQAEAQQPATGEPAATKHEAMASALAQLRDAHRCNMAELRPTEVHRICFEALEVAKRTTPEPGVPAMGEPVKSFAELREKHRAGIDAERAKLDAPGGPVAWMASYVDPIGNDHVYVTSHYDLAVENDMHGTPRPLVFGDTHPAPSVLKDDQIAALVNKVRDIARMFNDHQSLRERIAIELVPALKVTQEVKSDAERGRFLIEWLKRYGLLHAEFGQMGVGKKPENWWLLYAPWGIDQTRPFLGHGKTPEQAIDDAKEEPLTVATSTRTERQP